MPTSMQRRATLLAIILLSLWVPFAGAATLYGVQSPSGPGQLITIDTGTGAGTAQGATASAIDGLAFSPSDVLYAADNTNLQLVILDPANGSVLSVVGSYGVASTIEGLAFRPSDSVLFGIDVTNDVLVTINTSTGAVSTIGSFGGASQMAGLAFNLDGSVLYGVDWENGCLYTINQLNGGASSVGCGAASTSGGPLGMARDPVSGTLYVAEYWGSGDSVLATVSTVDGSRTTIGTITGFNQVEGLTFDEEVPVKLQSFSVE